MECSTEEVVSGDDVISDDDSRVVSDELSDDDSFEEVLDVEELVLELRRRVDELELECELVEDSDDAEEEDDVEDAKVEEVEENNWEEEEKDELDGSADDAD